MRPALSRKIWCSVLAAGLLAIHAGLLAYSASVHSPTLNEPGHLVAGISYWQFGQFDVYKVNPPLSRLVAALPVMAAGCKTDWTSYYDGPGARPEMALGEAFVHANGERSIWLFTIARWACIPFSLLGGYIVFRWANELYAAAAGILSLALWCFGPNILAHGSLITPDMSATALGAAACYTFWHWLRRPTWWQAFLSGAVLGVAELAKTTLLLFYFVWPVMWLVYRLPEWRSMSARVWLRELGMLAACAIVSIYVLNLGYGFEGTFTPLGKYRFVSDSLSGSSPNHQGSPTGENRFEHSWLAAIPVPLPKNYVEGIDLQKRDFEHYGEKSYLNGVWSDHGWWYYYLEALALKLPLGTWLLLLLAATRRLWWQSGDWRIFRCLVRKMGLSRSHQPENTPLPLPSGGEGRGEGASHSALQQSIHFRDEFTLLFPALVILAFVSSQTGFNEHMRYVLPIFPFFFIWIGRGLAHLPMPGGDWSIFRRLVRKMGLSTSSGARSAFPLPLPSGGEGQGEGARPAPFRPTKPPGTVPPHLAVLKLVLIAAALTWSIASSLWIYPHSLSYFNEIAGGPLGGPNYLLGSNVDWGQDLLFLKRWLAEHPEAQPIGLAYEPRFDPADLGITFTTPAALFGDGNGAAREPIPAGWYALSANSLYGMAPGTGRAPSSDTAGVVSRFRKLKPAAAIGYSIYIFHLARADRR